MQTDIEKIIKVMPLGDSMTHGFIVSDGGYRKTLENKIFEFGISKNIQFTGSEKLGEGYSNYHEGHPGWAIEDISLEDDIEKKGRSGISPKIDEWLGNINPDIVLLQIGTNDILSQYKIDEIDIRLKNLIEKTISNIADGGKIYIAKIPYIDANSVYNNTGISDQAVLDEQIDTYNSSIQKLAEEKNLTVTDINACLSLDDLADGVHPDSNGYKKMGDLWFDTVIDELKARLK